MNLSEVERRKLISEVYHQNKSAKINQLYSMLKVFKIGRRTVYDVVNRLKQGLSIDRTPGSGRKAEKMPAKKVARLLKMAENSDKSCGQLASKFNISRVYAKSILNKHNIKYYKQKEAPKSSPAQVERQNQRLKILTTKVPENSHKHLVIDDESYFSLENPYKSGFYSSNKENCPDEIKFHGRKKFPKRLCVWIAISPKGHSDVFFVPANCALNAKIYSEECIKAKLVPFIEKYYPKGYYVFWPDGASCHYASTTIDVFEKFRINYIKREENPPNVPQIRPIERFWSHLKKAVYSDGWETQSYRGLKLRIRKKLTEFDEAYFKNLFTNAKQRISLASTNGALSVIN